MAEAILRSRAELRRPQQPTGSFPFLGRTGVGKTEVTELAEVLAEQFFVFDDENPLIQIDMSEWMEQHSHISVDWSSSWWYIRYVGHEEGGQLTEAVPRLPYNVILFDEVEKAHTSVFYAFQILDDCRVTEGLGHTVDFNNSVIIMTSNLGAEHLLTGLVGKCKKHLG